MITKKTRTPRPTEEAKSVRTHVSGDRAPSDWQRISRRQFGRDQAFVLANTGTKSLFSEFRVGNPQSKTSCRVAIGALCPLGTTSAPAVQIVNFVAKRTIEEGMLSVPAFKRSLSAGILDGGSSEISLGALRLSILMKDSEKATGCIGDADTMAPAGEVGAAAAPLDDNPLAVAVAEEPVLADALATIAGSLRSRGC